MRLVLFLALFIGVHLAKASDREKQIRQFVSLELKNYPEAQLADLYKNYFQDAYGPGHLIPDTARAGAYIDWELQQPCWTDTIICQPLGIHHEFYRVSLSLLKNKVIPRDTLLLGMVKSAKLARNPNIEAWKIDWAEVLEVIRQMKPDLEKFRADEKLIAKTLRKGEVVIHHSKHYEKKYCPHYRIIHRSVFQGWRGKYLE